jgi:hypothetical protein
MPDLSAFGRMLVFIGVITVLFGAVLLFANKIPFLGKLPGDIYISRKNFTFYFPLATSIVVSVALSLIMWLWSKR